jgi:hypothetical protein
VITVKLWGSRYSGDLVEFNEFYPILEAIISSNTSLKQIELDVFFDSTIVSNYTEAVMSRLANNTTLRSIVICPGEIAFERNEQTGRMEFIDADRFQFRKSSLRHETIDMVPPPIEHLFIDQFRSEFSKFPVLPEHRRGHGFECRPENTSSITVQPQAVIQTMPSALMPPVQCRHSAESSSTGITQVGSPHLNYSGGSDPAHYAPCQIHPQPLTNLHRVPGQGQMSYESSWAQPYPSFSGTDGRQQLQQQQRRPVQALASAAVGGNVPAHYAVTPPHHQEQTSYEPSWAQRYPSYSGTDGRQEPQINTYPTGAGGTPAHGRVMPMQNDWQHRPVQALASAAVDGSVPAHASATPPHQISQQVLTNLPLHRVPYQGRMSYNGRPTGGTHARGHVIPVQEDWQYRPLQAQPSAPVNHLFDFQPRFSPQPPGHQSPSAPSCTIITTTSMPSFSSSSH